MSTTLSAVFPAGSVNLHRYGPSVHPERYYEQVKVGVLLGSTSGRARIAPRDGWTSFGPRTTSVLTPGLIPEMELSGEGRIFSLMLDPEWLGSRLHVPPRDLFLYGLAQEAATRLEREGTLEREYAESLATLVRAHLEETPPPPSRSTALLEAQAQARVLQHIEQRLEHPLSLAGLAAEAGLSLSHFARAFREAVGETPHRYVMRRRVERARNLLGQVPLAEAAARCGFSSQSHLTRCFAEHYGQPPGAFSRMRQKNRKDVQD